jgi:hypothetical protein
MIFNKNIYILLNKSPAFSLNPVLNSLLKRVMGPNTITPLQMQDTPRTNLEEFII